MNTMVLLNKKFTKWILGFGAGAEVQKPDALRQEIIKTIEKQLESYKR